MRNIDTSCKTDILTRMNMQWCKERAEGTEYVEQTEEAHVDVVHIIDGELHET